MNLFRCSDCCGPFPCADVFKTVTAITAVVSGIILCPTFICSGFTKRTLLLPVNGTFSLAGSLGVGWDFSLANAVQVDHYATSPCVGSPTSTTFESLKVELFCNSSTGTADLQLGFVSTSPYRGIFAGTFANTIHNGDTVASFFTSCAGSDGHGGTGTISW